MERSQFTFYRSFWEAISHLRKKEDRLSILEAICVYALEGEEREKTPAAEALFALIKPNLDSAAKKSAGGKRATRVAEDTDKIDASIEEDTDNKKKKEKEKEKKKEIENKKENECSISYVDNKGRVRKKVQIPPEREEVIAYCAEMGYTVNIDAWFAHYESNGWKVGRNPMKDWRAALRTWQHNGYGNGHQTAASAQQPKQEPARSQTSQLKAMIERLEEQQ